MCSRWGEKSAFSISGPTSSCCSCLILLLITSLFVGGKETTLKQSGLLLGHKEQQKPFCSRILAWCSASRTACVLPFFQICQLSMDTVSPQYPFLHMPFVFSVRLYCLRPNIKLRQKTRALTSEGILMLPEIDLQHDLIRNRLREEKNQDIPNIFYRTNWRRNLLCGSRQILNLYLRKLLPLNEFKNMPPRMLVISTSNGLYRTLPDWHQTQTAFHPLWKIQENFFPFLVASLWCWWSICELSNLYTYLCPTQNAEIYPTHFWTIL